MKLNFADVPDSSPLGPIPTGRYSVTCTDGEEDIVKASSFNAGAPLFKWTFVVSDGEYSGSKVWDNMVVAFPAPEADPPRKGTLWRVKQLLKACGMDTEGELEFEVSDVEGCELVIEVEWRDERYDDKEDKTYKASNRITRFIPASNNLQDAKPTKANGTGAAAAGKKIAETPALR